MCTESKIRGHPGSALAMICLSVCVISIDATILNVALSALSRDLGANTAYAQPPTAMPELVELSVKQDPGKRPELMRMEN